MALATVTVLVRCYVRIWLKRAFGWDDWTMVAALVGDPITGCSGVLVTIYEIANTNPWTHSSSYSISFWLLHRLVARCMEPGINLSNSLCSRV